MEQPVAYEVMSRRFLQVDGCERLIGITGTGSRYYAPGPGICIGNGSFSDPLPERCNV